MGPDPRFGMLSPLVQSDVLTTPGGLTRTVAVSDAFLSASSPSSYGVASDTRTTVINGRQYQRAFTANTSTSTVVFTSPESRTVTQTLDAYDRITEIQVPGLDAVTPIQYDDYGHLTTITQADSNGTRQRTITPDPTTGFTDSVADALGTGSSTTKFTKRDNVGRVQTLTLQDGTSQVGFTYDFDGNLSTLTPPGDPTHHFPSYSPLDQLWTYQPPPPTPGGISAETTYLYTHERELQQVTTPDGVLNYTYDLGGRLSTIAQATSTGTSTKTYGYIDGTSRVTSIAVTAPDESMTMGYDGPLLTSTTWTSGGLPASHAVDFGYDNNFWLTQLYVDKTTNSVNPVTLSHDNDGLFSQAASNGGNPAFTFKVTRDATGKNGLLSTASIGSLSEVFTPNGFGEPGSYSATCSGAGCTAATLYQVTYQHDQLGRITGKSESIPAVGSASAYQGTTCYTYDTLGRLQTVAPSAYSDTVCASPSAATAQYAYDVYAPGVDGGTPVGNGNLTQINTQNVCSSPPCYDGQDRLTSFVDAGGTSYTFTYTDGGTLQAAIATPPSSPTSTTNYAYDLFGNLKQVALSGPSGTTTIQYLVDGKDHRVGKFKNGAFVQGFLYADEITPIAELDSNGAVLRTFVYGTRKSVPDLMVVPGTSGAVYRIITDQVGSPRLVVNASTGNIAERIDYDPWGKETDTLGTEAGYTRIPFGFAGGIYDPDTGLVRFGARDYDPTVGRWTSKDPLRFDGSDSNLYAYGSNDPVNHADPNGEDDIDCALSAAAAGVICGATTEDPILLPVCVAAIQNAISACGGSGGESPAPSPAPADPCVDPDINAKPWKCSASCNVEGTEPQCTGRVTGGASGSSQESACRAAKRDATQKAARGCYARHCQCDCTQ